MKYSIEFERLDNNETLVRPYEDKIFDTRLEAKQYLRLHPGASGAKIVSKKNKIF